ncbi:363_t:CDS:2, partial [Acaulospora colombiana]
KGHHGWDPSYTTLLKLVPYTRVTASLIPRPNHNRLDALQPSTQTCGSGAADIVDNMAAVATLIARCGSVIRLARLISERYNLANTTLLSITNECSVVELALGRVEAMATSPHLTRLETNADLHDGFNTALDGCSKTLQAVFEEMERIGGSEMSGRRESSWKAALSTMAKLKFIISERRLKELLDQLRGQHHALQLLLQAYATESMKELAAIMMSVRPTLRKIREDASSIRVSRISSQDPTDRIATSTNRDYVQSIISHGGSVSEISSTQLTIDESLINTSVYRRQLAAVSSRGPHRPSQEPLMKPLPDIPEQSSLNLESSEVNEGMSRAQSPHVRGIVIPSGDPDANPSPAPIEIPADSCVMHEASSISERRTLISSEIRTVTQRLKALGSEHDFLLARNTLKQSRLDTEDFIHMLEELH